MEEIEQKIALVLYNQDKNNETLKILAKDVKTMETIIVENKGKLDRKLSSKGLLASFKRLSLFVGAKIHTPLRQTKEMIKEFFRNLKSDIHELYEEFKKRESFQIGRQSVLEKVTSQLEDKQEVLAKITESDQNFSEVIQSFVNEEKDCLKQHRLSRALTSGKGGGQPKTALKGNHKVGFFEFLVESKDDNCLQTNILKIARMNSKRMLKKVFLY